jgi:hypothetical protein
MLGTEFRGLANLGWGLELIGNADTTHQQAIDPFTSLDNNVYFYRYQYTLIGMFVDVA